ncbi:MAG: NAD(P)-dependent glycerol-3-phosphate dehydrogenase [Polyangiaceae bacterium]|nr:NAD(P)-dependent glycerol-3-phosphate dehydrogenase [Polyangiaceae bacterium]
MNATVLGAGAWGSALALLLQNRGISTSLWTWQQDHADEMIASRQNPFLPGIELPPEMSVTANIEEAVRGADYLVLVVPSQALRSTLKAAAPFLGQCRGIVGASKGIEEGNLLLMSEVVEEVLQEHKVPPLPFAALSGPSFAKEVAVEVLTNLVAASTDLQFAEDVQALFATDWLRVYTSSDPIGVEVGGALKNVIAIAAGACEGLGLGKNTQAALITRGVAEMARLVEAKGGERLTMAGLAGMGDLVLTCTGELSRNRTLGFKLGQGLSVEDALSTSQGVAEGYVTAQSTHDLAKKIDVDLPICEAVYSVLYGERSLDDALRALLSRPLRSEW